MCRVESQPHDDLFTPMANTGVFQTCCTFVTEEQLFSPKLIVKTFVFICLRLFSSIGQGLFLCIEAVNHLHCSRRSSGGWWIFIANEREFGSFSLTLLFFVWGLDMAWSTLSSLGSSSWTCRVAWSFSHMSCVAIFTLGVISTFLMTIYVNFTVQCLFNQ